MLKEKIIHMLVAIFITTPLIILGLYVFIKFGYWSLYIVMSIPFRLMGYNY